MGTMVYRLLRTLGGRTSFELVDGAQQSNAPWWATDALRSAGFVPAAAVRVKPLLMPASTTLLLVHEERRTDARVGFAANEVIGLTSYFVGGALNTGQTGPGPVTSVLHQSYAGYGPLELAAAHWRAQELVTARTALLPCDAAGAFDRYVQLWRDDLAAMRRLSGAQLRDLAANADDGGSFRGVALADQPGIAERLDALAEQP